jgi:curved DNA-binding protein
MTHYRVLMLDPGVDVEILTLVHRHLALRFHPDVDPSPGAHARMLEINRAYEVLRDPARRAAYDRQLSDQAPGSEPPVGATSFTWIDAP